MKHKLLIGSIFLSLFQFKSLAAFDFQDSTSQQKPKNHLSFVFKLDNRFSFARKQMISLHGFRTGLKWNGKHEAGITLNWLGSTNIFEIPMPIPNTELRPILVNMSAKFFYRYAGFFYEYNFYRKKRWIVSIPLQLGGGRAGVDVSNPIDNNVFLERREGKFTVLEPAITADYKIIRFAGIGAGAGYRFVNSDQDIVKQNLTKPMFILKAKIYLGELFRSAKKKDYRFFYFE
jgi:hypothetical protein